MNPLFAIENEIDRFNLAMDAIKRVPKLQKIGVRNHLRELTKQSERPLHAVLINLEASPEIDVTSLEMLEQLQSELEESGILLYFARVADRVRDLFDRGGFTERVGSHRI